MKKNSIALLSVLLLLFVGCTTSNPKSTHEFSSEKLSEKMGVWMSKNKIVILAFLDDDSVLKIKNDKIYRGSWVLIDNNTVEWKFIHNEIEYVTKAEIEGNMMSIDLDDYNEYYHRILRL